MNKFDKRPFEQREFIYTMREAARVAGVAVRCFRRWRARHPGFPSLPTTKAAVVAYLQRNGLPRESPPSSVRLKVVELHEAGQSFSEIGKAMGFTKQAAHDHWKAHLQRIQRQFRRYKSQ